MRLKIFLPLLLIPFALTCVCPENYIPLFRAYYTHLIFDVFGKIPLQAIVIYPTDKCFFYIDTSNLPDRDKDGFLASWLVPPDTYACGKNGEEVESLCMEFSVLPIKKSNGEPFTCKDVILTVALPTAP